MNKQWNKIIHDRLKDFPKKAPEGLLDDIKSEMLHRGLKTAPVSGNSRPLYPTRIHRIAAIAAIFLLLFGLGYLWKKYTDVPTSLPLITETEQPVNDIPVEQPVLTTTQKTIAVAVPQYPKQQKEKVSEKAVITNDTIPTTTKNSLPQKEQAEEKHQQKESPASKKTKNTYPHHLLASSSKRKNSSLSAGIYYSGSVAQINGSKEAILVYDNAVNIPSGNEKPQIPTDLIEKEHHQLPIRFGLSVRYYINDRWSIQSGLTYSYMVSDLTKSNQQTLYETKQKLHYIGIPLQAGFQIWRSNRFNGYITVGGQTEKLISGKATTDYSVNKKHQSTSTQKIHDKKLLFSVLTSVGIEYALGKNLHMYAEPGIHYYFKNGNGLKTTYNEHPLYFNITAGIRFNWNK